MVIMELCHVIHTVQVQAVVHGIMRFLAHGMVQIVCKLIHGLEVVIIFLGVIQVQDVCVKQMDRGGAK
jgi:hypothetical protein